MEFLDGLSLAQLLGRMRLPPFLSDDPQEVMEQTVVKALKSILDPRDDCPKELTRLLLNKEPTARPQTAKEVEETLKALRTRRKPSKTGP